MSGFAAIYNTDGAPVDQCILNKMRGFLASRGPDEQRVEILGPRRNVGLVHAAFHTTPEATLEHQPCTIDGTVWITGHLRIDARARLFKYLNSHDPSEAPATDAHLILRAYRAWGHNLVDRIIGDYSFVIWDDREQRFLAVRNHLGTRPLFYTRHGPTWIVSNTLNCIRLYPGTSDELDDVWIVNYLRQLRRADFETTVYRDIKRVPPGHLINVTPSGGNIRRYWQLEIGDPIYYKRREEYHQHFRSLAMTVIADRFRAGKAGVAMSGGLDSPSIVAFLLQLVGKDKNDILVNSTYFKKAVFDDEPDYVAIAAEYFGISVNMQCVDNMTYDPQWWRRSWVPPEPCIRVLSHAARDSSQPDPFDKIRVLFTGDGPDDALLYDDWKPYLRWLLKRKRLLEFGSAVYSRLAARPLSERFTQLWRIRKSVTDYRTDYRPEWIRSDVLAELHKSACLEPAEANISNDRHPWHPIAVWHWRAPTWQDWFDSCDPGFGGRLVEMVSPYIDLRMLKFLLSVPVIPWCHSKLLMRESLQGLLPEALLTRKKTPLSGDPWVAVMTQHPFPSIPIPQELARFVDVSKIPDRWGTSVEENRLLTKLMALQYWLSARDKT